MTRRFPGAWRELPYVCPAAPSSLAAPVPFTLYLLDQASTLRLVCAPSPSFAPPRPLLRLPLRSTSSTKQSTHQRAAWTAPSPVSTLRQALAMAAPPGSYTRRGVAGAPATQTARAAQKARWAAAPPGAPLAATLPRAVPPPCATRTAASMACSATPAPSTPCFTIGTRSLLITVSGALPLPPLPTLSCQLAQPRSRPTRPTPPGQATAPPTPARAQTP